MIRSRIAQGLGALLIGGVAFAALSPVLPFQDAAQPSDHHRKVLAGVGEWEGVLSMTMPGQDAPTEMPCTETVEALGAYWTSSTFTCDMGGMTFEGKSQLGYDPTKQKFVGTWIDAMNPHMAIMEGDWDEEKNAMVLHYDMFDAMTGTFKKMRNETVYGDDTYTVQFFEVSDAGESEAMQISMKRKVAEAVEAGSDR